MGLLRRGLLRMAEQLFEPGVGDLRFYDIEEAANFVQDRGVIQTVQVFATGCCHTP